MREKEGGVSRSLSFRKRWGGASGNGGFIGRGGDPQGGGSVSDQDLHEKRGRTKMKIYHSSGVERGPGRVGGNKKEQWRN